MKQVKDTNETMWNVYDVLYANDYNQIYPHHVQINIGQNVAERGITLPQHLAERWLDGEIRIALTGEKRCLDLS
ncbi:MAG: hypothetical protein V3R78_06370 [Thermodesulfobacteriota bacterium]